MARTRARHKSPIQKVDHQGDYVQVPRPLLRAAALRGASYRAQAVFLLLVSEWTGFNNGRIGLSIENIGHALGNQNHRANSLAMVELIERGLVECIAGPDHHRCKAREYRLTFIATGEKPHEQATNEWRDWRPRDGNFGPEETSVETWKLPEATAARRKLSTEAAAAREVETGRFSVSFRPEATATHITQDEGPVSHHGETVWASASELRSALNSLVADGKATAAEIARSIDMLPGTMSKFRAGKSLPARFRGPLHWELGRRGAFQQETSDAA